MTPFFLFAGLLLVAAMAFIVPPLWFSHRPEAPEGDRRAANIAIFRDQLAELSREREAGELSDADFEQARTELQRRLLEDVDGGEPTTAVDRENSRKTALVLVFLLPLLALAGYALLGNPRALDPVARAPQQAMTPERIAGMVDKLAARLRENPDDLQGWVMLARSYKTLGRHAEAAEAYAKAESAIGDDAALLADYAEALAMAGGTGLKGKPAALIAKALKVDPKNGHALFLAGAAAMEAGDAQRAVGYWEALLPMVEPDSDLDKMLRAGIEKMKSKVGK